MARKAAGMGSVYQRKSDRRWVAAISVGPRGKRTTIVRYARSKAKKEGKAEAQQLLDDLRKLARPVAGSGRTTVGQYLRSWLESAGRRSLKASTWRTYDVALRLHIDPAIGHVTLARLTAEHVDTMLAGMDLEPKGQRNVLGFLGRVLDVALDRGHVLRNAARLVDLPRAFRAEPITLGPTEARAIMAAVAPHVDEAGNVVPGDRLEALWVAALGTGLRQGELLGLRWADVDLDDASLTVTYALVRTDGAYALDEPKTARSRRALALPAFVVAALREHRRRQVAERLAAGEATADGLVFVSPAGRPLNGGWVSHRWRVIAAAAGVDVTFHGLRHTNATILRDRGIPEDVRMSRLGHTTTGMARRYAHATEAPERAAAAALDEALG
jgi:integrase